MSPRKLRPEAGSSVTLLLEIGGVPVTQVSVASRVRDASMIVPRAEIALDVARASGQRRVLLYSETCGESGEAQGATDLRYHRVSSLQRDDEPE